MKFLVMATLCVAPFGFAQVLGDATAVNAFSLAGPFQAGYGVAPGSRVALLGTGLADTASQEDFPLATKLGGATVSVTVGGTTLDCWILSTRGDRVIVLLPSATPAGDGTISLTSGPNTATTKIHVVPVALGLMTRNQTELGPAYAVHDNGNPVTLTDAAAPGENVTIRGTGLGAVSGDEGSGPVPADLSVALDIRIGASSGNMVAQRRSATVAGIDEIVVQIPAGTVQGCGVPIAIKAAGFVSNYVTIPVHEGGGACSDAFGFSSDTLSSLPTDRDLRIGSVSLSRLGISNAGATAVADSGSVAFASYTAAEFNSRRNPGLAPGACVVLYITDQQGRPTAETANGKMLLPGTVTVTGPNGTKTIGPDGVLGQGIQLPFPIPGIPSTLFLDPGSYTVKGSGSDDVGPFSVSFQLPAAIEWTNAPSPASALTLMIPRDTDLPIQWKNGKDPDLVLIQGFGLTPDASGAAFLCTELASKGSFNVPSFVLSSLPAAPVGPLAGPNGGLSVGMISGSPGRFTADKLDLGLVTFSSGTFVGIAGWQ